METKTANSPREKKRWPDAEILDVHTEWESSANRVRLEITVATEKEDKTEEYYLHFLGFFAVDLAKDDGEVYEVRKQGEAVTCTCSDYLYRRGPSGSKCKHGVALVLLGLLR